MDGALCPIPCLPLQLRRLLSHQKLHVRILNLPSRNSILILHSYLGDRAKPLASGPEPTPPEDDPLFVSTRCHSNFLENVPLALVVSAIAELNGANRRVLHYALASLFVVRVAHAELGLTRQFRGIKGLGLGRITGFYGSQVFLVGVAGWTAYLVKGYWGF